MLHDVADHHYEDEIHPVRDEEHDQVGTVEVQILLSWFFETSSPGDLAIDVPHAA